MSEITDQLPTCSFSKNNLNIPNTIHLADPEFNITNKIELLLGAEIFFELLLSGKIQLKPTKLYLQNSLVGWLFGGIVNSKHCSNNAVCNLVTTQNLNKTVERFWQVEGFDTTIKLLSEEERLAESIFATTTTRRHDGRFTVTLPFKAGNVQLGESRTMAIKRFKTLENKLEKNPDLKLKYSEFIHEYLSLAHMEIVPKEEMHINRDMYYLPHHAVFKETGQGKKIRVVFDGSARSSNGRSLNDNLLIGPTLQENLLSIITRFRTFQFVLTADVVKMYRQIIVHSHQIDLQRIIWRDNRNDDLEVFRLKRLTYGTSSAAFLAVRCLHQLAYDNMRLYPDTCKLILRDFYVDDILTGGESIDNLKKIQHELLEILRSGGFELSKWSSNEPSLLPGNNNDTVPPINLDKQDESKTLGLFWNCSEDVLTYNAKPIAIASRLTKRHMLSTISSIFDPLGLISPIIIRSKILIQQLWSLNLEWDEPVPAEIQNSWKALVSDLNNTNIIKIPRKALIHAAQSIELIGFADSSEMAYGAAIYLKSTDPIGVSHSSLLIAKSRVAPLKELTIPRLELLAALLLAQLTDSTAKILAIKVNKISLFTDSTIVLAWLARPAATWQTFVANRVAQIHSLTENATWMHVRTSENPADLITRGTTAERLRENDTWWHGPAFLTRDSLQTRTEIDRDEIDFSMVPEILKVSVVHVSTHQPCSLLLKFSDFGKLLKCTAWILRFINNARKQSPRILLSMLSTNEIASARITIIKLVQSESFANEIHQLKTQGSINKTSSLLQLSPFLDENGIIRVGGRLKHALIPYDKKFPIILPKNHHVTTIIIRHFHATHLHAGAQATLAALRHVFWVVSGRSAVRTVLHKCITCFKTKPKMGQQKMGDLPLQRVQIARPFLKCGVDFCGPLTIKEARGRGKRTIKAYVALFICFCTKAVHLELVGDLTTEGFLNALRRFISRRGAIQEIHSDNATNFVGTKNQLQELKQIIQNQNNNSKLTSYLNEQNIKWFFIPPRTPNFGGLWEANIKAAKIHLKRVIGESRLTFEEMYTFLTRIEACLNSRPLVHLSNDPNDLDALTPGHFLIGEALTAPTEDDLTVTPTNRLSRWQLIEQMRQHFWKRWRREYLTQLQVRSKWKTSTTELHVGDLVILVEDGLPPLRWPLGRVHQLHPGTDGVVRVATIRTSKGLFRRGISKICPVPKE